jgi:hypothetical protein
MGACSAWTPELQGHFADPVTGLHRADTVVPLLTYRTEPFPAPDPATSADITESGRRRVPAGRDRAVGWRVDEVDGFLRSLSRDGQPTAYLFRCRHCGTHISYSDFT